MNSASQDQPSIAIAGQRQPGVARPLLALLTASVLGGLGQSVSGSAAALLAGQIGGSDVAASLPQSVLVIGSAVAAVLLSRLTMRFGRGAALAAGTSIAALGAVLVVVAAMAGSLPLVLTGSALLGAGNTAVLLGRYAAAALGPESARARAMGFVLAATTIGAVVGPNLLAPTAAIAARTGLPALAGPYVIAAAAFTVAAGVLRTGWRGLRPSLDVFEEPDSTDSSLTVTATLSGSPQWTSRALAGMAVLSTANLVMVGVMTMAPVQLHRSGTSLSLIGLIISLHIGGMFAPSPISGWLTDRAGAARGSALGGAVLVASCLVAALAGSSATMGVAMLLLGVGWNLSLLSGSALLTVDVAPRLRPAREGWGETSMGVAASGGGIASGVLMAGGGYSMLACIGAAFACILFPLAWVGRNGTVTSALKLMPRDDELDDDPNPELTT